jgi:hypothetical protein
MTIKTLLIATVAVVAASCARPAETPAAERPAAERPTAERRATERPAAATAVAPVTTGVVVRGVTAPLPTGASGTANGQTCDFSGEEVSQTGHMTGASVQCRPGGTLNQALAHLPARFNSYCAADASRLQGRLIAAPVPGNAEHCDLSGIKPADAQTRFGGGKWR